MSMLTPEGQRLVDDVAARHGFSSEAVLHMLIALDQGGGTQAQFNHWELGGMGQWSLGGMTMIGDMFNNGLKARVDGLCADLSNALASQSMFRPAASQSQSQSSSHQFQSPGGQSQSQGGGSYSASSLFVPSAGRGDWWPHELGAPGSVGAQNDLKYAYFPSTSRLAILLHGKVTVYDTGPHQVSGFSQQQSGDQSITFTSQFGLVRVADLPVVSVDGAKPHDAAPATPEPVPPATDAEPPRPAPEHEPENKADAPEPAAERVPAFSETPPIPPAPAEPHAIARPAAAAVDDADAIFAKLERLGDLRDKGILTDEEFGEKKKELLARI